MRRSGRCEEREGRQQGRSIARATRGLRRPSLDARSLAQPCDLPEENHRPPEGEGNKETRERASRQVTRARLGRNKNREAVAGLVLRLTPSTYINCYWNTDFDS